jgi:hypothetical protein
LPQSYQISQQFQDFKLCRTRKNIRAVVATRMSIQQELRDKVSAPAFNNSHRQLLPNAKKQYLNEPKDFVQNEMNLHLDRFTRSCHTAGNEAYEKAKND